MEEQQPTHQHNPVPESKESGKIGISGRFWRIYVQVWLVSLIFPIVSLVQTPRPMVETIAPVVGLLLFVAFYIWSMQPHPISSAPDSRANVALRLSAILAVTLFTLGLSATYGSAFLWLLVGTSAVAGKTLPTRLAHRTTALLPLLSLGAGVVLSGVANADWLHIIPLALLVRALGLDMIGLSHLSGTIRELHKAREELARQAVAEERLRLARDLHDLLGHTLSLIVLKSELAGRLLERSPIQAKNEIRELETVARQALREVRQAVAGYRQPTLANELDGARQMLEAAGIAFTIDNTIGILPSEVDATLAWTIREGVTNVIRHSRARECKIQITSLNGTIHAEVLNDGYIDENRDSIRLGSGLSGLSERVKAQRGSIQAGPTETASNFCLIIKLPLGTRMDQEQES